MTKPTADYGAPRSLALQAQRTVEQEQRVLHIRQLQRQAFAIVKELETARDVDRIGLTFGRALLRLGCMALVNAITRNEDEL